MELTGNYDDIVSKLDSSKPGGDNSSPVTTDLSTLLDAVVQLSGGIQRMLGRELPARREEQYDTHSLPLARRKILSSDDAGFDTLFM